MMKSIIVVKNACSISWIRGHLKK